MANNKKKKKKKASGIIQNIILALAIICFLGSGIYLGKYYWDGYKAEKTVSDLKDLLGEEDISIPEAGGTTVQEDDINSKFRRLYEMNSDIIGWIEIEDTHINYPVMQTGMDDPEFYLRTNFHKEYEYSGTPFADARCRIYPPASTNIIIYGHNMKNKTMFADILEYSKKTFYTEHPYITFDTIYGKGEYEIVAVILSQAYGIDEDVFKYYDFIEADTQEEFDEYMRNIKNLQLYDTGVSAEFGDQLITLSTCEYTQEEGRMAIIAKKIK